MIVPRPRSLTIDELAGFVLDGAAIAAPVALESVAQQLQSLLRPATGYPLPIVTAGADGPAITFVVDQTQPEEGYRLTVATGGITIAAASPAGALHACQSLLQLLPPAIYRKAPVSGIAWEIPALTIGDAPRFGWRGAMLDVARHFLPKHDVLRFIDLLAMHKLNVLHLHLSDDQGWRVQIRRYPLLTEVGAGRSESQLGAADDAPGDGRPHGGFYTQDDLREIVGYAGIRGITVVPEIDVPGHSQAAIAAYPELGVSAEPLQVGSRWGVITDVLNTEDSTVTFYRNVFDEILELFPSAYIGVGGDECPKLAWRSDPRTQELMRQRNLSTEEDLQSWFIQQLSGHITGNGRRIFGWDELLEGPVPAGTVIASWRGMNGAITAARKGFDVVACPHDQVYLDYRQSDSADEPIPIAVPLTVETMYAFDPVPAELTTQEGAHVLGGQANIWTEHLDSARRIDYQAFPRLSAVAEALWSTDRDFADFTPRLHQHLLRLDAIGVEYRRATGPLPWQLRPGVPGR